MLCLQSALKRLRAHYNLNFQCIKEKDTQVDWSSQHLLISFKLPFGGTEWQKEVLASSVKVKGNTMSVNHMDSEALVSLLCGETLSNSVSVSAVATDPLSFDLR